MSNKLFVDKGIQTTQDKSTQDKSTQDKSTQVNMEEELKLLRGKTIKRKY